MAEKTIGISLGAGDIENQGNLTIDGKGTVAFATCLNFTKVTKTFGVVSVALFDSVKSNDPALDLSAVTSGGVFFGLTSSDSLDWVALEDAHSKISEMINITANDPRTAVEGFEDWWRKNTEPINA